MSFLVWLQSGLSQQLGWWNVALPALKQLLPSLLRNCVEPITRPASASSSSMSSASASPTMACEVRASPCRPPSHGLPVASSPWWWRHQTSALRNLLRLSARSCLGVVLHVLPELGRRLGHLHLSHLRCTLLLDADPRSYRRRLMAGKIQVSGCRMFQSYFTFYIQMTLIVKNLMLPFVSFFGFNLLLTYCFLD